MSRIPHIEGVLSADEVVQTAVLVLAVKTTNLSIATSSFLNGTSSSNPVR